jgi:hypothetical protein
MLCMLYRIVLCAAGIIGIVAIVQLWDTSLILASIDNTFDVKLGPNVGTSEELGVSVFAGDLNNDGYDDVIAGAYANNDYTGAVYVYNGSASGVSITPSVTINGEASSNSFGWAVASAGDVNSDGYDDMIVGAHGNSSAKGKAYIYNGSASGVSTNPSVTLAGEAASDQFGWAVGSAGDVNNDGYDDVIVGAINNNSSTGEAYIYYGSASGPSTNPSVTLAGEAASDQFGWTVAKAGDMNHDGYDDVLVAAYGYNNSTGRVYLYYGGSSMDTTPDVIFTGASINDGFGYAMSSAGDLNSDGYPDVIVGAFGNDTAGANAGIAYIYFGGVSMNNVADLTFYGSAGDFLGSAVASGGDSNNDGYDDVLIGAERYPDFNNCCTGRVYLYHGGLSMDTVADVIFDAEVGSNLGGYFTALSIADSNGDGATDFLIGAPGADNGDYDGAVYVYYGISTSTGVSSEEASEHSDTGGSTSEQSVESLTPPVLSHTKKAPQSQYNLTYTLNKSPKPLVVTNPDPESVRSLYLHIYKKKYFFTPSKKNPHQYTLKLPPSLKAGKYPYTLTFNYGFTTLSTKGVITVKKK